MATTRKAIDAARIGASIEQIQMHFGADDVASLVAVLEAIKRNPQDSALIHQPSEAFNGLGIMQGGVMTYAPYLAAILSDDLFNNPT